MSALVLVTGACGNLGGPLCAALLEAGYRVRMADLSPPAPALQGRAEFQRCDLRTPQDAHAAVQGVDALVHLAAWHSGHRPPVSDATIFSVNVDGTFHLLEAAHRAGVRALVFGSSMAYGHGDVYGTTKVLGEALCQGFQQRSSAAVAMLRYHAFVPGPYLEYGERLLRNGVDRSDAVSATLKALHAALERRFGLFTTVVHTAHGMPSAVQEDFAFQGPAWCEHKLPGARALLARYALSLPREVEQHDLSSAARVLGWRPRVGFLEFLRDLKFRDARGDDVRALHVPGALPPLEEASP